MSSGGKMALDFLVQASLDNHLRCSLSSAVPTAPTGGSPVWKSAFCKPASSMMDLANVAAEASPEPIPFSPISTHSNSSVEEEIERLNRVGGAAVAAAPPPPPPTQAPAVKSSTPVAASGGQSASRPRSSGVASRHHTCDKCGESFSLKVRYLHHLYAVHELRTHETRTILPCAKCNSAFLRNTDRSKHDACVHQRLRPFRCKSGNCSSSFFFAKDLSKHRSTVHLRHKPFSCHLCNKAFGKREHMTSHVKRVHEKLRPFRCDVCDISLASKYNLQGHLKTAAHAAAETHARRGI